MRIAERAGQRLIHQTRPARQRFTRNALDDIECREDDALLPQPLDQSFSEDDAAVGLLSRSGKLLKGSPHETEIIVR